MNQQQQDHNLNDIINSLYKNEAINPDLLDELEFAKYNDIAGYLGLMNFLYNTAQKQLSQRQGMVGENEPAVKVQKGSDILKMRGQIFKQYVKMLRGVLPDPAFFIARFDYQAFDRFCVHRGVSYLSRHTRGIYPEIDTKLTPLLQFLPFYNYLRVKQALVGNVNYKAARRTIEMYYEKQIKSGKINQNDMQDEGVQNLLNLRQNPDKNNFQEKLRNGVMLTYILVLEKTDEMQNYINSLRELIQNHSTSEQQLKRDMLVFSRFEFWYRNYKSYIREAMKMYQKRQDNDTFPLVYACDENNLEQTIIQTIQLVLSLKQNNYSAEVVQRIQQKIKSLIQLVKDNNIVPYDDKFKNNGKHLLLAYLDRLQRLFFKDRIGKSLSFSAYQQLSVYQEPYEVPYNRIFYTDNEIVSLYQSGKINQYPIRYDFQNLNTPILRAICLRNPDKIIGNIKRLLQMEIPDRLRFMIRSPLLGAYRILSQDNKSGLSSGQTIILSLQSHKHQFIKHIMKEDGKQIDSTAAYKIMEEFIQAWKSYYQGMRNFDTKIMQEFLKAYIQSNKRNITLDLVQPDSQVKIRESQFVHPMSRPDIMYSVTSRLGTHIDSLQKKYISSLEAYSHKNMDRQTQYNLREEQKQLEAIMNICQREQFKEMLSKADPNFVIDSGSNSQKQETSAEQEEHQQYFWRLYANMFICLGSPCSRLIGKLPISLDDEDDDE